MPGDKAKHALNLLFSVNIVVPFYYKQKEGSGGLVPPSSPNFGSILGRVNLKKYIAMNVDKHP